MYFSQTWNLTIAKNTNVNEQKSKNYEELNFSREKVQKYEKNWKSKNDFKSRLRALNKELWAIYVFFTTWNLTIAKNTNVNQRKSKNNEELNFSREKVKNMKKTESPKMTSKVVYGLLIRSYERFMYFSRLEIWRLPKTRT